MSVRSARAQFAVVGLAVALLSPALLSAQTVGALRFGDQNTVRREGWDRDDHRASDRGPNVFQSYRHERAMNHHQLRERLDQTNQGHRHDHPFSVGNHGSRYR